MKFLKLIIALLLLSLGLIANAQTKRNVKQEEANKKLVLTFYQQLIGDKDVSAIDKYLSEDFIQHNPQMKGGREALKNAVLERFKNAPKEQIDFRHVAAEGDLVFLHMKMKSPDGKVEAVADFFGIKNNKIIELWDVVQAVSENAFNPHPMF